MTAPGEAFDGVVLAGGRGRRLGGVDKAAVQVRDTSLSVPQSVSRSLSRVAVDALGAAVRIVIVGPERDLGLEPGTVEWAIESPPGGGPAAALAAGLAAVSSPVVVVLGADLPSIDEAAVATLVAGLSESDADGVLAVDDSGRDQYLCAAYRSDRLRRRLEGVGELGGSSMRAVLSGLQVARLELGAKATDVDTPEDLNPFS